MRITRPNYLLRNLVVATAFAACAAIAPCAVVVAQTCGGPGNPGGCGSSPASASSGAPSTGVGNPIDLVSGNKYVEVSDYSLPGELSVGIVRHYNSQGGGGPAFGNGWAHGFETRLTRVESATTDGSAGAVTIRITQADGRETVFRPLGEPRGGVQLYRAANRSAGVIEERVASIRRAYQLRDASAATRAAVGEIRPWTWRWASGRRIGFDIRGIMYEISDPNGDRLRITHDANARLVSVSDLAGRTLRFSYWDDAAQTLGRFADKDGALAGAATRLRAVQLPDGTSIGYFYDGAGSLSLARYPDGRELRYTYANVQQRQLLVKVEDRARKELASYTYGEDGRATSTQQGGGANSVKLGYRPSPTLKDATETWITNSRGESTVYRWRDGLTGRDAQLIDAYGPGCSTCAESNIRYAYDKLGNIARIERLDPGTLAAPGRVRTTERYERDEHDRLTAVYRSSYGESEALIERYEYRGIDPLELPVRLVRPSVVAGNSYVLTFEYNSRGQPTLLSEIGYSPSPSDALQPMRIARATRFAYFEQADGLPQLVGKLKSIDGPVGGSADIIRYEYDARGLLLAARHPLGVVESYQYDVWGRLEQMTPLDGIPVRLEYDTTGRATAFVRAGQRSAMSYDEQGRVATMADPVGQLFKFEYDGASRLTSLTDTDGFRVVLDIDSDGRATAQRLLNPDGSVSLEIEASPEEQLLASELQQSKWTAALSSMLRLPSVSEWNSSADAALAPFYATLDILAKNQRFAVDDERGLVSEYVYDDFDRLVRVENADSGAVYFAYDSSNRLRFRRGADNSVTEYRYDALARPTHIVTRDETVTIEYGKFSKPSSIRYAAGREEYRYDAAGRIRERVRRIDDKNFRTAYTYDQLGRLATNTLPDGQQLIYRYNASVAAKPGILNAILRKDLLGTTVIVEGLNEAADRFDRQTSRFGNGLEFTRVLDRKGRIMRFGTKGVAEFDFAMTEGGQISAARANYVQRYLYDGNGRVTAAASGVGKAAREALGLAYDDADNILSRVRGEAVDRFAIDDFSNRILQRVDADGTRTAFEYDAAGRTSKVGRRAYSYDGAGRISEVFDGERRVAQYSYNAFGERIKKVAYNGGRTSVTYFLYDGAKLAAEADGDGTITKQFVYVADRPAAVLVDRKIYSIHTDWRGAPLALTDENRQVVWRAEVGLWHDAQITRANVELNLRGSNQYFDAETGLHYNYHRYFDPQVGRYLTPDPIGQAGGLNLYAFVEGDAANNVDPLGLNPRNPDSLPDNTSVTNWSMAERIGYTLRVAVPLMPAGIRDALRDLVTSPAAAAAFGAIVLFMASNPAGWALTAVTAVATIAVALFAWDLIKGIIASVRAVANARCVGDLVSAGQSLATTTSNALVGGVASWLGAGLAVRAGRALRGAFDAARRLMPARPPTALPPQPSGVWGRNPFQRGRDIEAELNRRATASNPANRATPTNNYPVIDRWNPNTGLATSVKSIDLNAATYQTPANLSARIREYVDTLSRFNGTTHGGLRTNGLIRARELEIAIPRAASGAQQTVINNMIAYARGLSPPVTIRIVVYP